MADGKVEIEVILSDGQVAKGVANIDKQLGGVQGSGQKAALGIGKLVAALGLVALASKGIDMVKRSLDGAISRYDTLNNFPRVLQLMGFDAKQSQGAIDKLADGIDGLPTTLDSVAKTAQRLALMTGDLDGAVDTTLALNNAFLASGASAFDAERGLEQYVQMLSKGEVDLQSWRTLQETMPIALNETAKAFGFAGKSAQNDLYDALKDGKITFDEFNNKVIELSNKTGGFADIAREASGGIKTAWTNMNTAIVKGLADVIGAIDKALAGTSFGSIEGIINKMKDGIKAAFAAIVAAIPAVVDKLTEIYNTIKPFIPLLAAFGAGLVVFSVMSSVVSTVSTAIGVFAGLKAALTGATLATNAAASAQKAFNLVMSLNPIALVATALVGLVAALIYAYNNFESFRNVINSVFSSLLTFVQPAIDAVVGFIMEKIEFLRGWWNEVWPSLKDAFVNIWNGILAVAQPILMGIVALFQFVWPFVEMLVVSVWNNIKGVIDGALKIITGIVQAFAALFTGNWSALWDAVKQIFSGALQLVWNLVQLWLVGKILKVGSVFAKGLQNILRSMWNAIRGVFQSGVNIARNVVNTGFNFIRSVISSVMSAIRSIISSVWNAIRSVISSVVNGIRSTISSGFNAARSIVSSVSNSIRSVVSSVFSGLAGIVRGAMSRVSSAITGGMRSALNAVTNIARSFYNAGRNIVISIANGIKSAIGAVTGAISSVTSKIRNFLPFSPAKEGALRDIMKVRISESIGEAIDKGSPKAIKSMRGLTDNLASEMKPKIGIVNRLRGVTAPLGNVMPISAVSSNVIRATKSSSTGEQRESSKEPLNINLTIAGTDFNAFVDDVSAVQSRKKFRLRKK